MALIGLVASSAAAGDLADVKERGELVMICFPHQDSEFVAVDLSGGAMPKIGTPENFKGVDVDVMQLFADHLGVVLRIRPVSVPSYGELIPALLRGDGDVVASSLTITDERREQADFSIPYYRTYPVVIVREGSAIQDIDDLAGKVAATIPGSSQEQHLRDLGFDDAHIRHVHFTREAYLAVQSGEADFALVDSGTSSTLLAEMPDLAIGFRFEQSEPYGYAVRPGSDLLAPLNALLEELEAGGRLNEIFEKHGAAIP
jgi:ABC-type amino acid transport substrate-binding protein